MTNSHFCGIINTVKGVIPMDRAEQIIKKLIKLTQQLNKLLIEIISLIGWVIILVKLLE